LPVRNINHSGGNILKTATAKINLEFVECYKGLERIILGNLTVEGQIHNSMMIQMLIHLPLQTTLVQLDFIVLKLLHLKIELGRLAYYLPPTRFYRLLFYPIMS
jgi:hypothetical protein